MKRLYIAIALLIISISLCTTQQIIVNRMCREYTEKIDHTIEVIENNDQEEIKSSCKSLDELWQKYHPYISAMTDHACFDDAAINLKKIKGITSKKELKEALLELKNQIEEIREDEIISFGNIF